MYDFILNFFVVGDVEGGNGFDIVGLFGVGGEEWECEEVGE